jgi:hypothetical protein
MLLAALVLFAVMFGTNHMRGSADWLAVVGDRVAVVMRAD